MDIKTLKTRLDVWTMAQYYAMDVTGDLDENGKSTKWKVENSWGTRSVYVTVASDAWMDEYTLQIVGVRIADSRRTKLPMEQNQSYAPWDPMGNG